MADGFSFRIHDLFYIIRIYKIDEGGEYLPWAFIMNSLATFLTGGALLLGVYFFILYFFSRKNFEHLFLSLTCLFSGLYFSLLPPSFLLLLFPDFSATLFQRLFLVSTSVVGASALLVLIYFEKAHTPQVLAPLLLFTTIIVGGLAMILPTGVLIVLEGLRDVFFSVAFGVMITIFIRLVRQQRREVWLQLVSLTLLGIGLGFDLLHRWGEFPGIPAFGQLAVILFLILQTALISRRFWYVYELNQQMALLQKQNHHDLQDLNLLYARFVPMALVQQLHRQSIIDIQLGDQTEIPRTVFYSDIRDFTTMAETLGSRRTFEVLNQYLSLVGPIIRKNEGFILNYQGDAVLAVFPEPADSALRAALEIFQALSEFLPLRIGIGIHTGPILLGTLGEREHISPAVVSDVVEIAQVLEAWTKSQQYKILLSDTALTALLCPQNFHFEKIADNPENLSGVASVYGLKHVVIPEKASVS